MTMDPEQPQITITPAPAPRVSRGGALLRGALIGLIAAGAAFLQLAGERPPADAWHGALLLIKVLLAVAIALRGFVDNSWANSKPAAPTITQAPAGPVTPAVAFTPAAPVASPVNAAPRPLSPSLVDGGPQ